MRCWLFCAASLLLGIGLGMAVGGGWGMLLALAGIGTTVFFEWRSSLAALLPFPDVDPILEVAAVSWTGDGAWHGDWKLMLTEDDLWLRPGRRFDPLTLRIYTDRDYLHVPLFSVTDVLGGYADGELVTVEYLLPTGERRTLDFEGLDHSFVEAMGFEARPRFFPQSQDQDQVR